jgi:pyridoxamine 5'-phosphate oxidase
MATRLASLTEIESACWREIEQASRDRTHPWRTMALATFDGDRANARMVVLREARQASQELLFYTDDRSPKLAQLRQHPKGTLLMWSPALAWQLRLHVHLQPVPDGLEVSSRWARLKLSPAAQDYLSPLAPGAPLDAAQMSRADRDYFAVVSAHIEHMDWLELHAEGHRRAHFKDQEARWVQP